MGHRLSELVWMSCGRRGRQDGSSSHVRGIQDLPGSSRIWLNTLLEFTSIHFLQASQKHGCYGDNSNNEARKKQRVWG